MSSPGARHLVRLALLAVALLGVLAMHGLATHGVSHGESGSAVTSMVGGMHGDHGVPDSDGMPDGGDATVMVLCLALLGPAVIGLFRLRSAGVVARRRVLAGIRRVPAPPASGMDRDPPDLHRLSIQRC
jgi:hypothetical protein